MATIIFTGNGAYTGSTSSDTLLFNQTDADLSSSSLTSIEVLQSHAIGATTFTVDQADLAKNGSVIGNGSITTDTLIAHGVKLDLTSTTLTDIDILKTDASKATTF